MAEEAVDYGDEGVGYDSGDYQTDQGAPEAAPEWSPPGQDWYQNVDQGFQQQNQVLQQWAPIMQQLGQILNEPDDQGYAEQGYEQQGYDPQFADERGQFDSQQIEDLVGSRVEQALEPFKPLLGMIATREGETVAKTHLESLTSEVGKFDHEQALVLGSAFMEQGVEPEQALKLAAQQQHSFEQKIREEAIREYEENLRTRAGAPVEPASNMGSAGEVQPVPTGPDRYEQMAERFFQNRRLQTTP